MPIYTYILKHHSGDTKQGSIHASSRVEAVDVVKKDGYYILELKEGRIKKQKMSAFERINFTDHLASAIESGVSIRDAFEAYSDTDGKRTQMFNSMVKTIEQGKSLSQAFAEFPENFSHFYISMVRAGEKVGNLGETLAFVSNELRREHEFKQKVRSAMFYPAVVIAVALGVIGLIMVVVLPRIAEITQNLGAQLPLATRFMLGTSRWLQRYGLVSIPLLVLSSLGLIWAAKKTSLTDSWSAQVLKVPVIGKIIQKYTLYQFLRITSSCIRHGITYSETFASAHEVLGLATYRQACRNMDRMVHKGQKLSEAFAAQGNGLFPALIVRTVRGSEQSANLETALARLSLQYEAEVDRDLKRLTELLEPVIVVFLGVVVLIIAISVIAPIYQLTSQIK